MKVLAYLVAVVFLVLLSTLFLFLGWNHGVVHAIEGTRPVSFWGAMALSAAISTIGATWAAKPEK